MVTFWASLRFHLLLRGLRAAWWVLRWTVTAAVLVAAAPITLVAAIAYTGAWLRGWPPAKLWRAAAWSDHSGRFVIDAADQTVTLTDLT